jgi:hypothetical protein
MRGAGGGGAAGLAAMGCAGETFADAAGANGVGATTGGVGTVRTGGAATGEDALGDEAIGGAATGLAGIAGGINGLGGAAGTTVFGATGTGPATAGGATTGFSTAGACTGNWVTGGTGRGAMGGATASFRCVIAFSTSPGREICDRSILVLISSSPRAGRELDLPAADAPSAERRYPRTFSASCSSKELECVFFSVTPTKGSVSRMALLLTSSSRARSLIRTLLIRPFVSPCCS